MDVLRHKSLITSTFQRAAAEFDQSGVPFFTPMGRRLVALAAPRPGAEVLDIGCGRGACAFAAREFVGETGAVHGIDIAPSMIDAARADAARRGLANVTFELMDGEQPVFPAEFFDVVLAGFSLMHMPAAPGCLAGYLPLLKPGGRLCFSDLLDQDGLPPFVPPAVFALLRPHFPSGPDPRERGVDKWTDHPVEALTELGFGPVRVHDETFEMVVESGDQWNSWTMSTGLRAAWDNLSDDRRAKVWAATASAIDAMRSADGRIRLPVAVRYVIASRSR